MEMWKGALVMQSFLLSSPLWLSGGPQKAKPLEYEWDTAMAPPRKWEASELPVWVLIAFSSSVISHCTGKTRQGKQTNPSSLPVPWLWPLPFDYCSEGLQGAGRFNSQQGFGELNPSWSEFYSHQLDSWIKCAILLLSYGWKIWQMSTGKKRKGSRGREFTQWVFSPVSMYLKVLRRKVRCTGWRHFSP